MRKIEEKMVAAVTNVENWSNGNTMVAWFGSAQRDNMHTGYVFLHGHHIATVYRDGTVVPDLLTLAEWPTTTTKSRLRALGVNVYTKNFITYVDDVAIHQGEAS